jgi:hypothetical protein
MITRKRATPTYDWTTYAWAAVSKSTGKIPRDFDGHYSIWITKVAADFDSPLYHGRVARVRITEVKR